MGFVKPGASVLPQDMNERYRPSALIAVETVNAMPQLSWVPSLATLALVVVPVMKSWTNKSALPFVSPVTRLAELDVNATNLPSAEISGELPCPDVVPSLDMLARSICPALVSQTNTPPFAADGMRLVAPDENAINLPSALMDDELLVAFAGVPFGARSTRVVNPEVVS